MNLKPSKNLSEKEISSGLNLVVADGLATEAMVALTAGTFLVAIAIHLGATNFQLGLLAAMPTFTSLFQIIAIRLVQKFNNRRAITAISNFLSRVPLLVIAFLPFVFSNSTSLLVLISLLFFHYLFGAVGGASWNSWMKDLVPNKILGSFFSHRSRLSQIISVSLSLFVALGIDYIQINYQQYEIIAYCGLFLVGGVFGLLGVYFLTKTPEPKSYHKVENLLILYNKPLKDKNFRSLLVFNSLWAFSLNLATPFFTVYMMKVMNLPLSYVVGLALLGQISGIIFVKFWGRISDNFSNKTVINICAPIYVFCLLAWIFTAILTNNYYILFLLAGINIFSGISSSGINLAISNIGIKLAPSNEALVYLSAKNMIIALFSAAAPLIAGLMADYLDSSKLLTTSISEFSLPLGNIESWNVLFLLGGLFAMLSLRTLKNVKEDGEIQKEQVFTHLKINWKSKLVTRMNPMAYPISSDSLKKRILALVTWKEVA